MSGRKERREADVPSQFYVFSAFSAANQLVEAESAAKTAKKEEWQILPANSMCSLRSLRLINW
mgnify:FL=1|jgi:hypothetical protein